MTRRTWGRASALPSAFAVCTLLLLFARATPAEQQVTDRFALPAADDALPGAGPVNRKAWFPAAWREHRDAWARQQDRDRGAVVFVGDSITDAWTTLPEAFPGLKVANRGISGDTTRGVLARLQDDVLVLDPSAIVLLIGTNDLELGGTPDTAAGNMRLMLTAIERHDPRIPVVLCEVMPSSAAMNRPVAAIRSMNAQYRAAAQAFGQVTVLDTWTLFADASGNAPVSLFPDLLHPNADGYARWAAVLRPILSRFVLSSKQ